MITLKFLDKLLRNLFSKDSFNNTEKAKKRNKIFFLVGILLFSIRLIYSIFLKTGETFMILWGRNFFVKFIIIISLIALFLGIYIFTDSLLIFIE